MKPYAIHEWFGAVMKANPVLDSLQYMAHAGVWTTALFDILLLAGIVFAILVWRRRPEQRTGHHVWLLIARIIVGTMWWQQTIWKTPPTYGGLRFWMEQMAKYASSGLQSHFVSDVVLAHYAFFCAPGVSVGSADQRMPPARSVEQARCASRLGDGPQPNVRPLPLAV